MARAEQLIVEREREDREAGLAARALPEDVRREVAIRVGVGSIKYADLSCDRVKDYVFDIDRMVAFKGDTAGYLQYAHARARAIVRDAGAAPGAIVLGSPVERALVLRLLGFAGGRPHARTHRLAGYLYDLATAFTEFYGKCPVLASTGETRASRLAIVELAGRTLALGLDLLGIAAPDRM